MSKLSNKKNKVGFLIPAYNEEKMVGKVIRQLRSKLKTEKMNYEIIVVNDGSYDATAEKARNAGATVISHILNSGSGAATLTGMSYALQNDFDIIVSLDADGQHDPMDAIKGVNKIINSEAHLLVGSRLDNPKGMATIKVIGNKGLSYITYVLFGINIKDSQSGMRVYSKECIKSLRWKSSGYEYCSEMLWRAKQMKMKVEEYPIKAIYTEYSMAKGQNNWNSVNIIKSLLQRRIKEIFS